MRYSTIFLFFSCLWMGTEALVSQSQHLYKDTVRVEVLGTSENPRFDPVITKINPGDVIKFVVREGLHTVTSYHPDNRRPLRIPDHVESFDSGLLKSGDIWLLNISSAGVYDYFCLPHERMGHAGRIIAGSVDVIPDYPDEGIPETVLKVLNIKTNIF